MLSSVFLQGITSWYTRLVIKVENMLKKLLILACVPFLLLACDSKPKFSPLQAQSNVVVLGDSLTYGTGAKEGEDYVTLLASSTGWNVVNAGVPGNKSSDGLARLPDLLAEHDNGEQKIDLLVVELGGNDFLKQVPETETVRNLQAILMQAKIKRIQTVLLAIPEFSPVGAAFGNLSDHPLYEALAEETNTPLVENVFSEVLSKNALKSDAIHPNAEGYRQVEADLRKAFVELGFLAQK